jgi:hypothetical protein
MAASGLEVSGAGRKISESVALESGAVKEGPAKKMPVTIRMTAKHFFTDYPL